jgi:putative ABC transport system permease protein
MNWSFAYRNLSRNKRRTFSTGLAICVGFVAMNLLGAYIVRSYTLMSVTSVYMAQRGHFLVYKKGGVDGFVLKPKKFVLQKNEIEELKQKVLLPLKDMVEYTSSSLSGPALLSNGTKSHPVMAIAIESEPYVRSLQQPILLKEASDWLMPWQIQHVDAFLKSPDLIAVTATIADIMGFKRPLNQNDGVQLAARTFDGDLNAVNAEVGAEHSTGSRFLEDTIILVPLPKMQELFATEAISSMAIYLNPDVRMGSFEKAFKEKAKDLSFQIDLYRYSDDEVNPIFNGIMGFLYVMGGFFVLLISSAVSLTIVNALTMGIIERTREIGTLRAMGFTPKMVRQIFSQESLLVSLFAMIAGTFFSFLIAGLVNASKIMFQPPGTNGQIQFLLEWNMKVALASALILTFVTWLSAQIVIRRKSKTKLILLLHDIGESE